MSVLRSISFPTIIAVTAFYANSIAAQTLEDTIAYINEKYEMCGGRHQSIATQPNGNVVITTQRNKGSTRTLRNDDGVPIKVYEQQLAIYEKHYHPKDIESIGVYGTPPDQVSGLCTKIDGERRRDCVQGTGLVTFTLDDGETARLARLEHIEYSDLVSCDRERNRVICQQEMDEHWVEVIHECGEDTAHRVARAIEHLHFLVISQDKPREELFDRSPSMR